MKTVAEKQPANTGRLIKPILSGILCAFIVSVVLLLIFSVMMTAANLPGGAITPFACVSISVGAFFGGFLSARLCGSKGLLLGAVSGLLYILILYLLGAVMRQADLNAMLFLKIVLALVLGAVGGITGVNLKHRKSGK